MRGRPREDGCTNERAHVRAAGLKARNSNKTTVTSLSLRDSYFHAAYKCFYTTGAIFIYCMKEADIDLLSTGFVLCVKEIEI